MIERRTVPRTRTLKGAKISIHDLRPVTDCCVRNLSPRGACLEVTDQQTVPDAFELSMDSNKSVHSCRVVWRNAKRLGVEFC